jgi:hypothetical protein
MSRFARCETCRREAAWVPGFCGPEDACEMDGWHVLYDRRHRGDVDFCSWKCLADYVTVRMLVPPDGGSET